MAANIGGISSSSVIKSKSQRGKAGISTDSHIHQGPVGQSKPIRQRAQRPRHFGVDNFSHKYSIPRPISTPGK